MRAVTAWDVRHDLALFDGAALFIMPGGADLPYCAALNGEGNRNIRRFVEGGGSYLGLCAGGYYGCERIEFHKGRTDEISGARELGFFKGMAIGSIAEFGMAYEMTKRSAFAPRVSLRDGSTGRVYYHGGAIFRPDRGATHEVLARYVDLRGEPAAIVEVPVGRGRALLTGVHPEISPDYLRLDLANLSDGEKFAHLPLLLAETDAMRVRLWHDLLARCGLITNMRS